MGFEITMVVTVKTTGFWDVVLCGQPSALRWRQQVLPTRWYLPTTLHGTSGKTS